MGRKKRLALVNQEIIVTTNNLTHKGYFKASFEGEDLLVLGGYPNQKMQVLVAKRSTKPLKAVRQNYLDEKSDKLIDALCPHFLSCGGCKLQHINYLEQFKLKTQLVEKTIRQLEKLQAQKISKQADILAKEPFFYRNKMEFSFSEVKEGRFFGLHKAASFSNVINTRSCLLPLKNMQKAFNLVYDWFHNSDALGYNPYTGEGNLRHLVLRGSNYDGAVLVNFVAKEFDEKLNKIIDQLKNLDFIKGILFTENKAKSDAVIYEKLTTLYGVNQLTDKLGSYYFDLSIQSFFQVNTKVAELLYQAIYELFLEIDNRHTLIDLYCGIGSIGIYLSQLFKKIIGVEEIEAAVIDAKNNALKNNLNNLEFSCLKVEKLGFDYLKSLNADCLVLDPPRSGMHPKAIKTITSLLIKNIVFVSCNPNILLSQLEPFIEAGYKLKKYRYIDLFPQTPHVECLVLLERGDE